MPNDKEPQQAQPKQEYPITTENLTTAHIDEISVYAALATIDEMCAEMNTRTQDFLTEASASFHQGTWKTFIDQMTVYEVERACHLQLKFIRMLQYIRRVKLTGLQFSK